MGKWEERWDRRGLEWRFRLVVKIGGRNGNGKMGNEGMEKREER